MTPICWPAMITHTLHTAHLYIVFLYIFNISERGRCTRMAPGHPHSPLLSRIQYKCCTIILFLVSCLTPFTHHPPHTSPPSLPPRPPVQGLTALLPACHSSHETRAPPAFSLWPAGDGGAARRKRNSATQPWPSGWLPGYQASPPGCNVTE